MEKLSQQQFQLDPKGRAIASLILGAISATLTVVAIYGLFPSGTSSNDLIQQMLRAVEAEGMGDEGTQAAIVAMEKLGGRKLKG